MASSFAFCTGEELIQSKGEEGEPRPMGRDVRTLRGRGRGVFPRRDFSVKASFPLQKFSQQASVGKRPSPTTALGQGLDTTFVPWYSPTSNPSLNHRSHLGDLGLVTILRPHKVVVVRRNYVKSFQSGRKAGYKLKISVINKSLFSKRYHIEGLEFAPGIWSACVKRHEVASDLWRPP